MISRNELRPIKQLVVLKGDVCQLFVQLCGWLFMKPHIKNCLHAKLCLNVNASAMQMYYTLPPSMLNLCHQVCSDE